MENSSLLALVMLAFDPLTKQTLNIRLMMVAAARLLVACRTISTMGIWVAVDSIVSGSLIQKRMTSVNKRPLFVSVLVDRATIFGREETYVTPPTAMEYTKALGQSRFGFGISSVMCNTTSKAMSERADCKSPRIQETPSGHPVSFWKLVKTKFALVFSEVARSTILITRTARSDQYT